ncbi:Tex-like N-terminal domain-containing protein, partial [Planctomycetota bacterium]
MTKEAKELGDQAELKLIAEQIAAELGIDVARVQAAVDLLEAGNTLPFVARYRKEATKGLDETELRAIEDALTKARELAARKATILKSIDGQGQLTDELRKRIEACTDKQTLENIYLPFKPKRKSRASVARERGLQPLADLLRKQEQQNRPRQQILAPYVDATKDVPDEDAALQGACDIIAEQWAEDVEIRTWLIGQAIDYGRVTSKVKR